MGALDVVLCSVMASEVDSGDSDSPWEFLPDVGVVAGVCATEFFLLILFFTRPDGPLVAGPLPLPLFRFFITSVFKLRGRTTPCNFRKSPHALHSGWPSGLRRHRGVVCVKQFVQVVGKPFSPMGLVPPGLAGREGAAELKPDSGGEDGEDCGLTENMACCPIPAAFGVEIVRGIFLLR